MPEPFRITTSARVDGLEFTNIYTDEGNSQERSSPSVARAKAGTVTLRTDNDTGSLTLEGGHGVTTGQKLDVYWLDPTTGDPKARFGMTVGTVASLVVPVDGGTGDPLPVLATPVAAMVPVVIPFGVDGDAVIGIAVTCPAWGRVAFLDDAETPAEAAAAEVGPNFAYVWTRQSGAANPLAGKVTSGLKVSHGDTPKAQTVTARVVFNPPA